MTIDSTSRTASDLDVPDWMEDDPEPAKEVAKSGTRPALRATSSAALVVAKTTGRGLGHTARAAGVGGGWLGRGIVGAGRRWVQAYHDDYPHIIGLAKAELRATKETKDVAVAKASVEQWRREHRRHRLLYLGKTGIGTFVASGGLAAGGLIIGGWVDLLLVAAGLGAAGWTGRRDGQAAIAAAPAPPAIGPGRPEAEADDGEPFPLAWCKDGEQVQTCVHRALKAEGISVRRIDILGYRGWGWEIDVQLKGSTPGKVNAAADNIDTHLNLPQGGTLIETNPADSAHIVLRLVISDPFANMPKPAVHAPNSLSVRDLAAYGLGMDGSPLAFRLRGMSMLVIGSSGSAKTKGALRSLAEAITACRDAIAIEMDPIKDGLAEFEGVMAMPPIRGGDDCTEWLARLKRIASVRNQIKRRLDMGDLWEPSPEYPSIYAIVDEFIYLPKEAKAHAIELLRIGRETGVHIIFAAQEATEDALGDAVASAVTYRVLLASRSEDVRLVFGKGASADGYRPDRLRPAVDDERVYDAGKFYIKGPGFLRPIQWRWHRLDRNQIRAAVKERADVGRPWFDHDSLAAADLLHVISPSGRTSDVSLADRLDQHARGTGIEDATIVATLLREFELSGETFLPTATVLLPALANSGYEDVDSERLGRLLRKHAPGVTASRDNAAEGKPRGWERSAIEQAAAGLMDPVRTRVQAGPDPA